MAGGKISRQDLAAYITLLTGILQTKKNKKSKKAGESSTTSKNEATSGSGTGVDATAAVTKSAVTKRHQAPQVEEADDE